MKNPYRIVFVLMSLFCLAGCDMGLTEEELKMKYEEEEVEWSVITFKSKDDKYKMELEKTDVIIHDKILLNIKFYKDGADISSEYNPHDDKYLYSFHKNYILDDCDRNGNPQGINRMFSIKYYDKMAVKFRMYNTTLEIVSYV